MAYNKKDIEDFFSGKLSKSEAEKFINWLDSSEGKKNYEVIIEQIWHEEDRRKTSAYNIEKNAKKFIPLDGSHNKAIHQIIKADHTRIWLRIAASFLLIFSVSFIFYLNPRKKNIEETPQLEEILALVKSTPKGKKKIVSLPDGSKVILNSESKLTYNSDFIHNRSINLEGEGFFEVEKDEAHPFTVITGKISTTALGTSFNVRAYGESSDIQVSLASGKVRVQNVEDKNLIEINPGEAVDFSTQRQTLHKKRIDISKVLHWKEGILHFDKVPFHQVIMELERWYGVEISLSGTKKVLDYKCTGTFKKHEYLSNVLKVLSYSLDFEYEINKNQVELKFK
jgi:transmembrane sensor